MKLFNLYYSIAIAACFALPAVCVNNDQGIVLCGRDDFEGVVDLELQPQTITLKNDKSGQSLALHVTNKDDENGDVTIHSLYNPLNSPSVTVNYDTTHNYDIYVLKDQSSFAHDGQKKWMYLTSITTPKTYVAEKGYIMSLGCDNGKTQVNLYSLLDINSPSTEQLPEQVCGRFFRDEKFSMLTSTLLKKQGLCHRNPLKNTICRVSH